MSQSKDKHYWGQLRAALTSGQWEANHPAKAPNAASLSWSELLRKFNKHCPGFADIAELASQTQALSILLSSTATDASLDIDGNRFDESSPLALGDECMLPEERIPEASHGYNVLKGLTGSNTESIHFAVAYYAYALGHPSECLSVLSHVKELTDHASHIPATGNTRSALQVPNVTADSSSSSSWTGSFTTSPSLGSVPDIENGKFWAMTECVRSICLQGMAHERISPDDPHTVLSTYLRATPLLNTISSDIPCSLPSQTGSATGDPGSFVRYRELWRWTERLLRRMLILAAKIVDLGDDKDRSQVSVWTLFNHYGACSAHWPSSFRPYHRSAVLVLHIRAHILRARALAPPAVKVQAPRWMSTARSAIQEYRTLLNTCTSFPRAGERNVKVEDFVDLCVAVWEADGAVGDYAGWVIDVLWWATRLTFNSFRIFRHITRLLCVSGDPELAKRTLRLYVQVVSKAREASLADTEEMRQRHDPSLALVDEVDTDRHWVDTLIFGTRMLCRLSLQETDYGVALELAHEAGSMVEKAKTRLDVDDAELVGKVILAEGIWNSVMAFIEQEPLGRISRLAASLDFLTSAVETYPTPSGHHHLALALSRPGPARNLEAAIQHARTSVEGDPDEVRHWHLLGLLLAKTGDWTAAKSVLELGVEAGESDLELEDDAPPSPPLKNGLNIRDFASSEVLRESVRVLTNGHSPQPKEGLESLGTILQLHDTRIPSSDTLLQIQGDRPSPSRHERFEYALQVRMTQLALTEFVSGAEGVGEKWLEVFQWFREKRGVNADDRRMSIDSRRVSMDRRPLSEIMSVQEPLPSMPEPPINVEVFPPPQDHPLEELPTPIPITITPASPGVLPPHFIGDGADTQMNQLSPIDRRSNSLDEKAGDISRGKKVKQVLKTRVHKSQATISTISKKIGHGVGRRASISLKQTASTPDFHSVLGQVLSQASSIHLRQYHSIHASQQDLRLLEVPPPPPSPSPTPPTTNDQRSRSGKDRRLLSDLWLMSAAIFRRLGKIEQARGAIQEAEVRDEDNPAVWVQLGLYYAALNERRRASEAFHKALFIAPNDVSATIHLCRLYLSPPDGTDLNLSRPERDNIDLAVGLLSDLTKGAGWDVAEAWYFLAKGYKLQGRRDRERDCLSYALTLSETRGVRDINTSVGHCL